MTQFSGKAHIRKDNVRPAASKVSMIDVIIDSIQDKKGKNIVKIDLTHLPESPSDYFIICEADSITQMKAISDNIYRKVKEVFFITPNHTEGLTGSKWFLVDYFDTVVHIFYPEIRVYYNLEDLWSDGTRTNYSI